ncbi:hypothetical protein CAN33_000035 [Aspergillus niger]|uniref:Uncharacterized protein n=1 Tax=Aspergillus niger TaxID=5061 RepID=A0A505HQ17_ASPNG|nr:hypothetical protein CAN33_000035 [Aspergillus niger]
MRTDRGAERDHSLHGQEWVQGPRGSGHGHAQDPRDQRKRSVSAYLGPETFSNVYVAELRGLVLANKTRIVLMAEAKRTGRMPVFSDSPATVRAMHAPRMSSDQPTQVALLGVRA